MKLFSITIILLLSLTLTPFAAFGDYFVSSITDANGNSLNHPHGIATDSNDRIIVVDAFNDRILIFDSNGNFVSSITDANGSTFNNPHGVTTDSLDRIIVADTYNDRIVIFEEFTITDVITVILPMP